MATPQLKEYTVLHMLERVSEPLFYPKGNGNVVYQLPSNYIDERLESAAADVASEIQVAQPELVFRVEDRPLPNLEEVLRFPVNIPWSIFIPSHRRAAYRLIEILVNESDFEGLKSTLAFCRDKINRTMFVFALEAAVMRRPDLRGLRLPAIWEVLPDRFVDAGVIARAGQEAGVPAANRRSIRLERNFTGTDMDPEHRVAYWREDLGMNAHHWHWHLVYTQNALDKDRKGELFYYMHQQMIARYDAERFSSGLFRVRRLQNWETPIEEAYYPKLTNENAGFVWGTRSRNNVLSDISRADIDVTFDLDDLRRWRDRIFEAIHQRFVVRETGERINLDDDRGIDILGDIVEASELNPNPTLYGDLHNMGHVALSYIHDPDGRHRESMGMLGDTTTAMRDPVFYRWHKFVDDLFQEHKSTLVAYTDAQLGFPDISIQNVTVQTEGANSANLLTTFWEEKVLDLARGIDLRPFRREGPVSVTFTHLQHDPFTYTINVNNAGSSAVNGTVRIYLAPRRDEAREQFRNFREQRILFIELDKFPQRLESGTNVITRRSDESTVSIPFEQTFQELRDAPQNLPTDPTDTGGSTLTPEEQYCGCGWPHHLLIPRGTPSGMEFDLFVMISNDELNFGSRGRNDTCRSSLSYCGLRDMLYPDTRPMGFPFDRNPAGTDNSKVEDYQTRYPNMRIAVIRIQHNDARTVMPRAGQ